MEIVSSPHNPGEWHNEAQGQAVQSSSQGQGVALLSRHLALRKPSDPPSLHFLICKMELFCGVACENSVR